MRGVLSTQNYYIFAKKVLTARILYDTMCLQHELEALSCLQCKNTVLRRTAEPFSGSKYKLRSAESLRSAGVKGRQRGYSRCNPMQNLSSRDSRCLSGSAAAVFGKGKVPAPAGGKARRDDSASAAASLTRLPSEANGACVNSRW